MAVILQVPSTRAKFIVLSDHWIKAPGRRIGFRIAVPPTSPVTQEALRAMLAQRSGLPENVLWAPLHHVQRRFGLSWPLTGKQAEDVLSELLDGLRRVLARQLQNAARPTGSSWGREAARRPLRPLRMWLRLPRLPMPSRPPTCRTGSTR
ncbi:hypothetical protein [Streptomyces chartreusis]